MFKKEQQRFFGRVQSLGDTGNAVCDKFLGHMDRRDFLKSSSAVAPFHGFRSCFTCLLLDSASLHLRLYADACSAGWGSFDLV